MGDLDLSFSNLFTNNNRKTNKRNNRGNNNNNNNNNNNEFTLNAGERGASPSSLPASPMIPIPERKFTEEELAVIDKFVAFIQITNVNEKPKLTKVEKDLLRGMFWSRQFMDLLQRRLQYSRIRKESANLEKNLKNILSKTRSRRRNQRKTRKV
jgi:hypothetical protein